MVTQVTSLGRSGLYDWLIQRASAVVMAAYFTFLVVYLVMNPGLEYTQWVNLYQCLAMKIFSLLAFISLAAHAWIGIWAVLTDYVTTRMMGAKATGLRLVMQMGMIAVVIVYLVWAIDILWSI